MTRTAVSRALMELERIREASYEADTKREERQLTAEYNRLWKAIEPFISGREPYTPEPA